MLLKITLAESEKWDEIVKSFENFDVYYLSGYTKAFKLHGDGEPILIYYEDDMIRAVNVVMLKDISNDKLFKGLINSNDYFDISTPYGYGGFLIEGKINNVSLINLDEEYINFCKKKNIVCEFVRYHPVINNSNNNDIYKVVDLGKTITLNLISRKQIWEDLSSKNRNVIRKAIKSGVEIYWSRDKNLIEKFIPMYMSTMNKDNASEYYYFSKEYFESILYDLKYNSLIFYAVYENKIISMSIIIFANKYIHYHLSTSDRKYQSLSATNLLLYEVACWGCENGFKYLHLGGGLGGNEDSLYKFKKAFNKNQETVFSIGKKIFDLDKYDYLLDLRSRDSNFVSKTSFFPQYRK